ncbi:unnamed protein product [Leuciscus chuanchicus]
MCDDVIVFRVWCSRCHSLTPPAGITEHHTHTHTHTHTDENSGKHSHQQLGNPGRESQNNNRHERQKQRAPRTRVNPAKQTLTDCRSAPREVCSCHFLNAGAEACGGLYTLAVLLGRLLVSRSRTGELCVGNAMVSVAPELPLLQSRWNRGNPNT